MKELLKKILKNKIARIISIILVFVFVCVVFLLIFNNEIIISFDTNGAKSVDIIKIRKGECINLPEIEKDGFIFDGWYLDSERVTNKTKFNKSAILKAKWISDEIKTFKVTFDSVGGSKVDSIVLECGQELILPTNPIKENYTFVSWIGNNQENILDGVLLPCEDIILKANWKRIENKKADNMTSQAINDKNNIIPTTSQPEKIKNYNCPSGYILIDNNKCEIKTPIMQTCKNGYTKSESRELCYKTAEFEEICGQNSFSIGNGQCASQPLWPSGDGNKEKCENSGFQYGNNGKCYIAVWDAKKRCPSGYTLQPVGWIDQLQTSSVCVETIELTETCLDGYSREDNWCYKIIDAIYE